MLNVNSKNIQASTLTTQNSQLKCDILILEDEPLMSALIQRYLRDLYEQGLLSVDKAQQKKAPSIQSFSSGWELIDADLSDIKLVIMDILLPKITGVDLAKNFRKRFPHLAIVPITGMATEPMRRSLESYLPEGFPVLSKPLRRESFFEVVLKAWENPWQELPDSPLSAEKRQSVLSEEEEPLWHAGTQNKSPVLVEVKRKSSKKAPKAA